MVQYFTFFKSYTPIFKFQSSKLRPFGIIHYCYRNLAYFAYFLNDTQCFQYVFMGSMTKIMRAQSIPLSTICPITSTESDAGPILHMILVFFILIPLYYFNYCLNSKKKNVTSLQSQLLIHNIISYYYKVVNSIKLKSYIIFDSLI